MSNSSNKSNPLTRILFRRFSTSSKGPTKPPRREICYQHQNQSHYENLMSPDADFGGAVGAYKWREDRDDEKFPFEMDESTPLIPIAIPQLVENRLYPKTPLGKVVIMARKNRTRSESPKLKDFEGKKVSSILKNGSSYLQNSELRKFSKSTLQRTKSNPHLTQINKSIPVSIPIPPEQSNHVKNISAASSKSLLNVSWTSSTLEKKRDMILNYFSNLHHKRKSNKNEPIYEEIPDIQKSLQAINLDTLKPKISPKKVRLNLPPDHCTSIDDYYFNDSDNLYQVPPNYEREALSRSLSFNDLEKHTESERDENNNNQVDIINPTAEFGLANFTQAVTQQAKTNSNFNRGSINRRSKSFSIGFGNNLKPSSNNDNKPKSSICDMDEIYILRKRGKKVGTPTTRLLKRHQSQLIGKFDDRIYTNFCTSFGKSTNSCCNIYSNMCPNIQEITDVNNNVEKQEDINKNKRTIINTNRHQQNSKGSKSSAEDYQSEAESGFSLEEGEDFHYDGSGSKVAYPKPKPSSASSNDSCYTNSSGEEGDEESESIKSQKIQQHPHQLPPARPPRAIGKAKPTLSKNSQIQPQEKEETETQVFYSRLKVGGQVEQNNFLDFITNVSVRECNSETSNQSTLQVNSSGSINLADEFPQTGCCHQKNVLTISVIDSTQSIPKSDSFCQLPQIDLFNLDWYRSLKKGTVIDESVVVTYQTPKDYSAQLFVKPVLELDQSFVNETKDTDTANNICDIQKPRAHQNNLLRGNNSAAMSASIVMSSASIQDDKLHPSNGLLIQTQNLWDTSSPSSSSSPNSHSSSELEVPSSSSSTTTTSDLSEISVHLAKMSEATETLDTRRNQFIGEKYYDDADADEDGGFESFQVADPEDHEDRYDEGEHSDDGEEGQFLGISENAANRQRTFAQLSQNIPEAELKQKASSVLDLINAEISDLHMREMELKKKNAVADGKQDYDNDSEDLVEGSSQADSEDYSDSAVDVGSYSRAENVTPADSGNVTPADSDKNMDQREGSPQSTRGSYHPAQVEKDIEVDTTSKQVGVKVRPIVEEEVKSIELSLTTDAETPIEREIRLVREREEEFKRLRSLSSGKSFDSSTSLPDSPASNNKINNAGVNNVQTKPQEKKISETAANVKSVFNPEGQGTAAPKDLQYEMATARLKREIEENLMRERELFNEGRLKSLSGPLPEETPRPEESVTSEESGTATPMEGEMDPFEEIEKPKVIEEKEAHSVPPSAGRRMVVRLPSTPAPLSEPAAFKTTPKSAPPNSGSNSMRFFSPMAFSSPSSPQSLSFSSKPLAFSSFTSSSGQTSLPFAKAQFTSIEKMILKGSLSFNKSPFSISDEPRGLHEDMRFDGATSMRPDPLQIVQRSESIDETDEGDHEPEEQKPRRKYVPAQDKIQLELQEQVKREKELSQLRAKWKSTPDLSKSSDKEDENEAEKGQADNLEGLTKPSSLKRQMSSSTQRLSISEDVSTSDVIRMNKPTVRRRNSALINQWEEMIKKQQEKNNKN